MYVCKYVSVLHVCMYVCMYVCAEYSGRSQQSLCAVAGIDAECSGESARFSHTYIEEYRP